jgi:transcriptional regulator with XRE-family HTH domain
MDYFLWVPERIAQLRLQKGVSARDMSLSLGQSESYINKIENRRTLPSMAGFLYICEYFGITPGEFFDTGSAAPQQSRELLRAFAKLTPTQACHILQVVQDLGETAGPLKK